MSTVYVVGLGPGAGEQMTVRAEKRLLNLRRKPDRSWTLSI